MNTLELNREDIDQLIQKFRANPSAETFQQINAWYENNVNYYQDGEYMVCVYLFLVGANIRHRYNELSYDQHMDYIREIREIIDSASALAKSQRKVYLDYGSKSGFHR